MGKLLDLKFVVDHRLLWAVNVIRGLKVTRSLNSDQREQLQRTRKTWQGSASGKCLICGNGPSLNELTFSDFKATPSFTANYFFKHGSGSSLCPKYYVIIDGKIVSGVWPVSMIDDLFSAFPETSLFLDVRWLDEPCLQQHRKDSRIYWILPAILPHANLTPRRRLDQPICGLNVVAATISLATAMGYTDLGIAGVDGDGLFREILDMQSHFYDGAKDHSMRDYESMVKSLMLSTENLWAWHGIVKTHKRENVNLVNLCRGGIMDCMPRVRPTDFLQDS